ncbi:MAG: TraR/DksA family transcriptional regulator [Burkholderiales bacterium]
MAGLSRNKTHEIEALLLAQRRASLEEAEVELARVHDEAPANVIGDVRDTGDEATAMYLTDLNNALARRHLDEVGAIDQALAHVRDPHFGICEDCGGEIPFARLQAFPTATRCTTCQSKREHLFAHGATPSL